MHGLLNYLEAMNNYLKAMNNYRSQSVSTQPGIEILVSAIHKKHPCKLYESKISANCMKASVQIQMNQEKHP